MRAPHRRALPDPEGNCDFARVFVAKSQLRLSCQSLGYVVSRSHHVHTASPVHHMVGERHKSLRRIFGLGDDMRGPSVGATDLCRRERSSAVGYPLDVCCGDGSHARVASGRAG